MMTTIEPISTIQLDGGATDRTYFRDDGWLHVSSITDQNGNSRLYIFRSAAIDDHDDIYAPVRALIGELSARLVEQWIEPDDDYIFSRRETLIFRFGGNSGERTAA